MDTSSELNPENRYELDQKADAFAAFIESYPSFMGTKLLDEWRETEYSRLDNERTGQAPVVLRLRGG